jgi:hypothetical protein
VFSAVIGLSLESAATWRALDASGCRPLTASGYSQLSSNSNTDSTFVLQMACPIVDGNDFSKAGTTLFVDIDQRNPSSPSRAAACINSEGGLASTCGPSVPTSSGTGARRIAINSSWTSSDYGYVFVSLAPASVNGWTAVRGYYWSN